MTVSIQDCIISTKTYQKEGNPYLYINPSSAHQPGMIKGDIFGSIKCYFQQNSSKEDFISITKLFFQRLVARDGDTSIIKPIFISALNKIKTTRTTETINRSPSSTERGQPKCYYARDKLWCKTSNCYSCPRNIQDVLTQAALFEPEGNEVSK